VPPQFVNRAIEASRRLNLFAPPPPTDQIDALVASTRELARSVGELRLRTDQLLELERANADLEEALAALPATLDVERVRAHVVKAIEQAELVLEPFPHLLVDKWLPADIYRLMIEGLPAPIFFADRDTSRQRLTVPFRLAPRYSKRVWKLITRDVVGAIVGPALNARFQQAVRDYVQTFCPGLPPDSDLTLGASNGHILLRRPGYVIAPHRDPKWGFLIGLVYLARPGDNEAHGTKLYRVKNDREAPTSAPYYIDAADCELTESVPFRANTLLVFLNSRGAHGASIPADAQPPTLERYLYQFRLGPKRATQDLLLESMTDEAKARWVSDERHADRRY
jgi:hypothetical protein